MDYDEEIWSEFAMKLLEGYVHMVAKQYYIPGLEYEDLCQELRMQLWRKLHKYNPKKAGIKAWALRVLKNKAF